MTEKRYAIVRIDEGCPIGNSVFKEIELKNVCNASKSCSKCLIGDTKEQMVMKVAQAIRIISKELNRSNITMTEEQIFKITAKFVVEFLGVEE